MKVDVYNLNNEIVGQTELPDGLFAAKWNATLVAQAVAAQAANARHPWAHAKGRSEVRGGGKKPWRQKGTGRARHGSIRSPLWIGGGKAHGPNKERDYSQKLNKKMKRAALAAVLSKKLRDKELKVVDSLAFAEPKTKLVFGAMRQFLGLSGRVKKLDLLMVPASENKNIYRSSRNLVKTKALSAESLNVGDILNFKNIVVEQGAVSTIGRTYHKQ